MCSKLWARNMIFRFSVGRLRNSPDSSVPYVARFINHSSPAPRKHDACMDDLKFSVFCRKIIFNLKKYLFRFLKLD